MARTLRGIRGAVTATADTSEAILDATTALLRALQDANGFALEDVESAIFTSTPDLTAAFPARAAEPYGPAGGGQAPAGAMSEAAIITAKGAERWRQGHPWIYRADVASAPAEPGIVRVTDRRGRFLGQALCSPRSQ